MRRRWAELLGHRPAEAWPAPGSVAELIDRWESDELERGRKPKTVHEYCRSLAVLRAAFGARRYAASEHAAAHRAGDALRTADVQRWLDAAAAPVAANRHLAVLSEVFAAAKRWGLTEYSPAAGVRRHREEARTREPAPWEVECLLAVAIDPLDLWIRWALATGWRASDILALQRGQLRADGIHLRQAKRGKRQVWAWSPELRAIVAAAAERPGAADALALWVRPARRGETGPQRYTLSALESAWRRAIARANALLDGAATIDDLHFHDLRAAAIAEAHDQGRDAQEFAGHSDARTTRGTYLRRAAKVTPLR